MLQLEKLRLAKEKDDQLDCTTARYEERLVELHSVIAELSRQLEEKSRDQINEEESGDNDEEEDEEDETEKNEAVESRTSTEVNDRALEVYIYYIFACFISLWEFNLLQGLRNNFHFGLVLWKAFYALIFQNYEFWILLPLQFMFIHKYDSKRIFYSVHYYIFILIFARYFSIKKVQAYLKFLCWPPFLLNFSLKHYKYI